MPYKISLNTLIIIGFKRIPPSVTGKEYHVERVFPFEKKKEKKRKLLTNQQWKESFFVFGVNFLFILLSVFIFIRILQNYFKGCGILIR